LGVGREPGIVVNGITADLAAETLRDRTGAPIALRPQAFAVLRYLAENPDRLVTKDELMAAVWPDVAVTDDSLVQCVHDIRRALGDEAHAVLRTVQRRGYRLVLPEPAPARRAWRRGRILAVAAALLAVVAATAWWVAPRRPPPAVLPLVAVLPFDALSDDEPSRLLAEGLTEDVITDLAQFPEFGVLSRNATAAYAGAAVDPRQIRAQLDAGFVIEGSIARLGDRVRITAQLISADSGSHLWSARWDRPAADLFAIQTEIAEEIANRLGGGTGLVEQAGRVAARRKPPGSLDAYEAYLLGTAGLARGSLPDVEVALGLLKRAVELDPGFARAWLELYYAYDLLSLFNVAPEANQALAGAAAARALALAPGDAEAHAVEAMSLSRRGDHARAKTEFDAALRLAPNHAEILTIYCAFASNFGEAERGAETCDRARRLDPGFPAWKAKFFSYAYFVAERYDDALDMIDRLTPETYTPRTWAMRASALAALGRSDEAETAVADALAAWPGYSIETVLNFPGPGPEALGLFIDTMRSAGFPPCASPDCLGTVGDPVRLPECEAEEAAHATTDGAGAAGSID
jgi:TolB-like protein/Flp pilus assembly protein TadD